MEKLDLGFAEKCEWWKLRSCYFPSKIGGKPAWLDLKNIPSIGDLQCRICIKQMTFLCQIYAPYEEDLSNFHRTLFIFVCRNPSCCSPNCADNFTVFRSNLPQKNLFYPDHPVEEKEEEDISAIKWEKLCQVCGCRAVKYCAKCAFTFYCCREHQLADWKDHKKLCGNPMPDMQPQESKLLFSEFELVIDEAEEENKEEELDQESALQTYEQLKNQNELGTMQNIPESELNAYAGLSDHVFQNFVERLKNEPEQVLRYNRGKTPLLIAKNPLPEVIPNCEYCSSPRQFEFQILPHLLVLLNEQDIDWGTLIIYSCKNSCSLRPGYKQEYIFKQDVSSTD